MKPEIPVFAFLMIFFVYEQGQGHPQGTVASSVQEVQVALASKQVVGGDGGSETEQR